MITFDNKTVTYNDNDGMISLTPSTIGDDTYSWQGRRLMSISGTKNIQFEYNEQGLRTFKRVDTGQTLNSNKIYKDYEYVYDLDNKLICQRVTYLNSIDTMIFLYHDDHLYGFEYAQSKYFYLRDSLGNINGIIDSTGKLVVEYVYNAFGKIIDILGEMKDTIGVNNPMRYKGYYYDSETQMYYCNSRYYNPDFCRWISGDSEKYIDTETPLGLNLFVYCNNDPVNNVDENGKKPKTWHLIALAAAVLVVAAIAVVATVYSGGALAPVIVGAIIGGVTSAGMSVGTQLISGTKFDDINWDSVIIDGISGMIMGAFGGSAFGLGTMMVAGTITGAGTSLATELTDDIEGVNGINVLVGGLVGLAFSAIGGRGGSQYGKTNHLKQLRVNRASLKLKGPSGYRTKWNYKFGRLSNKNAIKHGVSKINKELLSFSNVLKDFGSNAIGYIGEKIYNEIF